MMTSKHSIYILRFSFSQNPFNLKVLKGHSKTFVLKQLYNVFLELNGKLKKNNVLHIHFMGYESFLATVVFQIIERIPGYYMMNLNTALGISIIQQRKCCMDKMKQLLYQTSCNDLFSESQG